VLEAGADAPHDKPALSKGYLTASESDDAVILETSRTLRDAEIALHTSSSATALDVTAREVHLDTGSAVGFEHLVIAAGCNSRTISFLDGLRGVHYLRTLTDSRSLRTELAPGRRILVIGGGFIGTEVAATAKTLGLDVTILDAAPAILDRVLPTAAAAEVAQFHERHGVKILNNVHIVSASALDGRVNGVNLADGTFVPADLVVVGIGTSPNTDWLAGSGLDLEDGIVCDQYLRTRNPRVWAVGDIASWFNGRYARQMRMQHWTSAREQASAVAWNLTVGAAGIKAYSTVPYIWSDQYDMRIQHVGMVGEEVVHEELGPDKHLFLCMTDGSVTGATTMNCPTQMLHLRKALLRSVDDAGRLRDWRQLLAI
jgi:NADPH-dependent 2,4-dienoyl-CoA reductase/sulfur reductase-like enzyme